MAGSRLEKIGTIFSRTAGLLRSGALKSEDKPIWYDIYERFPPALEPRFDRPAPTNMPIRDIFYEDDIVRAEFCKKVKRDFIINLSDSTNKTPSQMFIDIHKNLKQQGALSDEKIFEVAEEMLKDKLGEIKILKEVEKTKPLPSLSASFVEAKNAKPINIKDIFNDG